MLRAVPHPVTMGIGWLAALAEGGLTATRVANRVQSGHPVAGAIDATLSTGGLSWGPKAVRNVLGKYIKTGEEIATVAGKPAAAKTVRKVGQQIEADLAAAEAALAKNAARTAATKTAKPAGTLAERITANMAEKKAAAAAAESGMLQTKNAINVAAKRAEVAAAQKAKLSPHITANVAKSPEQVYNELQHVINQRLKTVQRVLAEPRNAARRLQSTDPAAAQALTERIVKNAEIAGKLGDPDSLRTLLGLVTEGQAARAASKAARVAGEAVAKVHPGRLAEEVAANRSMQQALGKLTAEADDTLKPALNALRQALDDALAAAPKATGSAAAKAARKKAASDAGFAATDFLNTVGKFLPAAGGAMAGGAVGAQSAPEGAEGWDKWKYTLGGALTGAILGGTAGSLTLGPLAAKLSGKSAKKEFFDRLLRMNATNLLASPGPLIRANLGAASSVLVGAAQKMARGEYDNAAKILRQFTSDIVTQKWLQVLVAKEQTQFLRGFVPKAQLSNMATQVSRIGSSGKGLMGLPGRFINAGDTISVRALRKGGYSLDEIRRMNLGGSPQTATGRYVLKFLGEKVAEPVLDKKTGQMVLRMRHNKDMPQGAKWLSKYIIPFPKVTVGAFDRAAAYSPAVLTKAGRQKFSSEFGKTMSGREALTRVGLAGAAGYGGYQAAKNTSGEFDPALVAAAGPLAIPAFAGVLAGRVANSDTANPMTWLQKMGEQLPLIGEQFRMPWNRIMPSGMRDLAAGFDPAYDRQRGATAIAEAIHRSGEDVPKWMSIFGDVFYKTPGFREKLPELYAPVDANGQPLYPERPGFIPDVTLRGRIDSIVPVEGSVTLPKALIGARPSINPSIFPTGDPIMQQIKALQQEAGGAPIVTAPSVPTRDPMLDQLSEITGKPSPMIDRDVRLAALAAKGAPVGTALASLLKSSAFQRMTLGQRANTARDVASQVRDSVSAGADIPGAIQATMLDPKQREKVIAALRQLALSLGRR